MSEDQTEVEFAYIQKRVSNIFKGFFSILNKYFTFLMNSKKTVILLLLAGLFLGGTLDYLRSKNKIQRILVIPNFNSNNYLYDNIQNIDNMLSKDNFLKKNVKDVSITTTNTLYDYLGESYENKEIFEVLSKSSSFDIDKYQKDKSLKINFKYQLIDVITKDRTKDSANLLVNRLLGYLNNDEHYNKVKEIENKNLLLHRNELVKSVEQINAFFENIGNQDSKASTFSLNSFDQINDMLGTKERFLREINKIDVTLSEQDKVIYESYRLINIEKRSFIFSLLIPLFFIIIFSIVRRNRI